MFSTVVAYGVFAVASFLGVAVVADEVVNHKQNSMLRRIGMTEIAWGRLFVLFAVWAASGIFIWG